MLGQRLPIPFERVGVSRRDPRGLLVCGVEDQRRLVLDPWRRAVCPTSFGNRLSGRLFRRACSTLCLTRSTSSAGRQDLENAVEIDAIVPDVQRVHRGVVGHSFAVGAHGFRRRLRRVAVEQPDMMGGDDDAGRQPLDVPLPWRRQGFVEIVDVEEDVALRRGEAAEIHEVSVAARLHAKPGGGGRGQVGRHDRGRAAIEGERRLRHAPEAYRDQLRNPAFIGLVQKLDRIAPVLGRLPAALRCARRGVAQRLARGAPFVGGYVSAGAPAASFVGSCFAFVLRMPMVPS